MDGFDYSGSAVAVTDEILESHRAAWQLLAEPGTWFTGAQRLAIAARARVMFASRDTPPWARPTEAPEGITEVVSEVVDLVTLDAGSINRLRATMAIENLGEGQYVELVGIVATTVMIDIFAEAMGVKKEPFPNPIANPKEDVPSQVEPDGLGDIGAHVRVLDPFPAANVARALSLVPEVNKLFRTVSVPTYSSPGFADLTWETPLSRPQVELVASRVAAMNECFY